MGGYDVHYMESTSGKKKPDTADKGVAGTQAVARATALLRDIATSVDGERGLAELAQRLSLERPTAYRILRRLTDDGLVVQNPVSRGYALGPLLYELGLLARPPVELRAAADEALGYLADHSGDTAFALIPSGVDSVCLARKEGSYPVKALMMGVGRRRPMGIGASSLAMLAAMPAEEADRMLLANAPRLAAMGEADADGLRDLVRKARREGHVLRPAADAPEILSLGVAARNPYGTPILGLSISALRFRIEGRLTDLVHVLHGARKLAERRLSAVPSVG